MKQDTLDQLAICNGYRAGADVLSEFPADIISLERLEPVYEWFDGWRTSIADVRRLEDLPTNARRYLDGIQALVEAPIRFVSVGTRRDQIIEVS